MVEQHIAEGRPSVVVGGRRPAKTRHNLADVQLTAEHWRKRWDAAGLFLSADGESGAPHGNYTITVDPADGSGGAAGSGTRKPYGDGDAVRASPGPGPACP